MKTLFNTLIALSIATSLRAEDPRPALPIRQALDIAEKARSVRESGDKVYVASISLERAAMMSGKLVWFAKWSSSLPANNPAQREIGVEIAMDGSVTHMIKGPGEPRISPR